MKTRWKRIYAVMLRHLYNFRHNYDRMTDAFYWPFLDLISFGFLAIAVDKIGIIPGSYMGILLTNVILWFVLWRAQNELSVNFLEELWSLNLENLFSAPLSMFEYIIAVLIINVVKIAVIIMFSGIVAYSLYGVNILSLGIVFMPIIGLLFIIGVTLGLFFIALFLHFGSMIQTLAWAGGTLILPFSGVYYPVSVLPKDIQWLIRLIPASYAFETSRTVLSGQTASWVFLLKGYGLALFYFIFVLWFFVASMKAARNNGLSFLK